MRATRRKNSGRRVVRKRSTRKASRRSRARSVKKGGKKHPEVRKLLAPNYEEDPTPENYYNFDFYELHHLYKNAENGTPDYYELMAILGYEANKLATKGVVDGLIGLKDHLKRGLDEYNEKYKWLVEHPGKTVQDYEAEFY